jgi:hypothetical protein
VDVAKDFHRVDRNLCCIPKHLGVWELQKNIKGLCAKRVMHWKAMDIGKRLFKTTFFKAPPWARNNYLDSTNKLSLLPQLVSR